MTYDHERAMSVAEARYLTPPDDDHIEGCPYHEDSPPPECDVVPGCLCEKIKRDAKLDAAEAKADMKREDDI